MRPTVACLAIAALLSGTSPASAPTAAEDRLPRVQGDLSIAMSLEDASASSGGNFSLDYTVWNTSSEEVETEVAFYLSADPVFDSGDTFLEDEGISIDENDSESDSEQVTLPPVANGGYYVLAFVDPYHQVSESNENNNVAADSLFVGPVISASTAVRLPCTGTVLANGLRPWASTPELGDDFVVEIDDPSDAAGLPTGTATLWLVTTQALPGHPCGVVVGGLGPNGANAEVMIPLDPPPVIIPPTILFEWGGPGNGALHELLIPSTIGLAGAQLFTQGLFVAPDGRVVLTNGLDATLGT
ncbi:MAG: CARDB domain-containing protein [Planctomycetota bacterium]